MSELSTATPSKESKRARRGYRSHYNRTNTYKRYSAIERAAAKRIDDAYRWGREPSPPEGAPNCHHCGWRHSALESDCNLVGAPYYVVATDSFFSQAPGGNVSYSVVPCATWEEVRQVEGFMNHADRSELKRVRVVMNKPRHRAHVLLCQVIAYRYRAMRWSFPRLA